MDDVAAQISAGGDLAPLAAALKQQGEAVREATATLVAGRHGDPEWPLRVADDYLRGVGLALMA
jgi:hypothetical protein